MLLLLLLLLLSLPQLLLRQAPATSGCCSDEFNESIQRQMPVTITMMVMTMLMMMTRPNTLLRSAICTDASCRTVHSSLSLHVVVYLFCEYDILLFFFLTRQDFAGCFSVTHFVNLFYAFIFSKHITEQIFGFASSEFIGINRVQIRALN